MCVCARARRASPTQNQKWIYSMDIYIATYVPHAYTSISIYTSKFVRLMGFRSPFTNVRHLSRSYILTEKQMLESFLYVFLNFLKFVHRISYVRPSLYIIRNIMMNETKFAFGGNVFKWQMNFGKKWKCSKIFRK